MAKLRRRNTKTRGRSPGKPITEPIFVGLEKGYVAILRLVLRFKIITLILVIAGLVGSLSLFPKIGMDFAKKFANVEAIILFENMGKLDWIISDGLKNKFILNDQL